MTEWACYSHYLIYRVPPGNDFENDFIIVNLKDAYKKQIFVKDFTKGKEFHDEPVQTMSFLAKK